MNLSPINDNKPAPTDRPGGWPGARAECHDTAASPAPWYPIARGRTLSPNRAVRAIKFGSVTVMLVLALACAAGAPSDETLGKQDNIPTPDRSQVQIIDRELPAGLTDPTAAAAYDAAIRIQPEVAGLYEARGTAYMYAGQHDEALADYSLAIELDPTDAGLWRRRSHAHTIAPTPQVSRTPPVR